MEISYEMDVFCLTNSEVNYELSIRGFGLGNEDVKRRKCLRRLLVEDAKRPDTDYTCSSFALDTDGVEIDASIASVSSMVESSSGILESTVVEIRSRLNHLMGRVLRIPSEDKAIRSFRNERLIHILALEDDFLMADVLPAEGGQTVVEPDYSNVVPQNDDSFATDPAPDMTEVVPDTLVTCVSTPCQSSEDISVCVVDIPQPPLESLQYFDCCQLPVEELTNFGSVELRLLSQLKTTLPEEKMATIVDWNAPSVFSTKLLISRFEMVSSLVDILSSKVKFSVKILCSPQLFSEMCQEPGHISNQCAKHRTEEFCVVADPN